MIREFSCLLLSHSHKQIQILNLRQISIVKGKYPSLPLSMLCASVIFSLSLMIDKLFSVGVIFSCVNLRQRKYLKLLMRIVTVIIQCLLYNTYLLENIFKEHVNFDNYCLALYSGCFFKSE